MRLAERERRSALKELGVEADVQKIEDINEIVKFGVMSTPALAVDGEVKIVGKVATPEEIKAVLPQVPAAGPAEVRSCPIHRLVLLAEAASPACYWGLTALYDKIHP